MGLAGRPYVTWNGWSAITGLRMTSAFRKKLYDSLEGDAVFFNSKYQLGDILGLLSEDVSHIQNLYLRTVFPMIVSWSLYVIIVVGIGFCHL